MTFLYNRNVICSQISSLWVIPRNRCLFHLEKFKKQKFNQHFLNTHKMMTVFRTICKSDFYIILQIKSPAEKEKS